MRTPETLRRRLQAGRVIPFVGAGVSMAVERLEGGGRLFPSWRELIFQGADRLEAEGKPLEADLVRTMMRIARPDYLYAAQHLRDELGPVWPDFLRGQIDLPRAQVASESLALARAIWTLGSRLILTTNYDQVLKWACPEELSDDLGAWDIQATAEQAQFLRRETLPPTVWHLHGRIRNAAQLILTPDGYGRLYGADSESAYQAALATLRHLMASHTLLFVGFSLDDEHFGVELRSVAQVFEGYTGPHYALIRERDVETLQQQNLPIEPLTFEDFGEPLLERLAEFASVAAKAPYHRDAEATPEPAPGIGPADSSLYLEDLLSRTDHIDIRGIASQHTQGASRHPIERLYTPLSSRGLLRDDATPERALHHELLRLADLLPRCQRLLIEGQPGSGKTTFLRFAASMLARDLLGRPGSRGFSWRQHHLGMDPSTPPRIPVLLRLADLAAFLTSEDAPKLRHDNRQWILDLLARSCQEDGHPIPAKSWQHLLSSGDALLLLDGLDEAAEEKVRERVLRIVRDAHQRWRCPIVITSRPIDTAPLNEMGFHSATIEPFGDREIRTFIDLWVAALHGTDATPQSGEAGRYRESLTGAIVGRSRVRRLAANPVMLTCLCVVHWNEGRLPEGRSRVYRSVLRWLIASRSALRENEGFTDLFARQAFARLALAMMDTEGAKRAVLDLEEAAVAVAPLMARERPDLDPQGRRLEARRWLGFECLGSGIVEEVAGKRLRFWHLTFQEFSSALELAWRGDGKNPLEDWWPVVKDRLDDAQWRETIELLPGCLLDEGGVGRVDRLLERVLALRGEDPDLATDARVAGILGRLLRPLDVLKYKPSGKLLATYRSTLERSMAIFEPEGASQVPVKTRIEAAEALGRGGDPRLVPGEDNLLDVPGLEGKRLGKYPVTVEDFQRFVEARGYEEQEHWDEEGWAKRQEEDWAAPGSWEEQLAYPNRPVTEVSWYEARAYCRWLAAQRGIEIRLPSEVEWEQAATPEEGEYPWGKVEPDAERANFSSDFPNPDVGSPTPVGIYPAGDGPYRHCDLAGNVWEWCLEEGEELSWAKGEPTRVLRGGGWYGPAVLLRAACRSRYRATDRYLDVGFRVLAAPASI